MHTDGYCLLLTAYCAHGGSKFVTFDGVELDYNVTSCWHLLAKDCSGHSRFAVLIRSINGQETVNRHIILGGSGTQHPSFMYIICRHYR
jgi:hypothetical protein